MAERIPGMGRLESAIMQAVWAAGGWLTIRDIGELMEYDCIAYTSVQTVTGILHGKGLLDRESGERHGGRGRHRCWYFRAAVSRDGYLVQRVAELLACADDPAAVAAAAVRGGGRG